METVTKDQGKRVSEFKALGEARKIAGYASVAEVDYEGDLVTLEAMQKGLGFFSNHPVVFWNHEVKSKPIGKVTSASVDDKGLWVEVEFADGSEEADEVYNLVQQDVLRHFSLHWWGDYHVEERDAKSVRVWDDMDIIEISVVAIPGNGGAQIVRKSLKLPEGENEAMIAACKLCTKSAPSGPERDLAIAQVRLWYSEQGKTLPDGFGEKSLDELEWAHNEREVFGDYLCAENQREAVKRLRQVVDWAKHREGLELGEWTAEMKQLIGELVQGEPEPAAANTGATPEEPRSIVSYYFDTPQGDA